MKTKFNIVFITSIILGFWYVAGRSYFDGLLNTTGFNPAHIGMEVSDYTYFGFLHSYPHLLITGFISSALYLIYEAFKRKNIFLTEFYFCLAKINHIF
ncbi:MULTISPECIES: hypothetical protein [Acinetobacter]|nr:MULTISPECIES: hypothetical protein [Acinetobacter]MBJ8481941.1 hypothetical protein [Acinetobacter vivianii]